MTTVTAVNTVNIHNSDNPMNMVGHYTIFIQLRVRKMRGNFTPAAVCGFTHRRETQIPAVNSGQHAPDIM